MALVLVTGPAGTLGSALVPRLIARGHQVRVLVHHRPADYPPLVQVVQGDVRSPAGMREAVAGVDAVVHAATSPFRRAKTTELRAHRPVPARLTDPRHDLVRHSRATAPQTSTRTAYAPPWYARKTQPSIADMLGKLRRVLIAARFKASRPDQPTPEVIHAIRLAWEDAAA